MKAAAARTPAYKRIEARGPSSCRTDLRQTRAQGRAVKAEVAGSWGEGDRLPGSVHPSPPQQAARGEEG